VTANRFATFETVTDVVAPGREFGGRGRLSGPGRVHRGAGGRRGGLLGVDAATAGRLGRAAARHGRGGRRQLHAVLPVRGGPGRDRSATRAAAARAAAVTVFLPRIERGPNRPGSSRPESRGSPRVASFRFQGFCVFSGPDGTFCD